MIGAQKILPLNFEAHFCSELYSSSTVRLGTMSTVRSADKKSRNNISRIQFRKVIRLETTGYVHGALET